MIISVDKKSKQPVVLLVDDNSDIQFAMSTSLSHHGCKVIGALSGEVAIQSVAVDRPDIAIVDYGLARMTGIEVGRLIRESEFGKDIDLILLSGNLDPDLKQQAEDAGFDAYFVKPISMSVVLDRIENPPNRTS